jgi:hypothetical protein
MTVAEPAFHAQHDNLCGRLSGRLITPADAGHDAARTVLVPTSSTQRFGFRSLACLPGSTRSPQVSSRRMIRRGRVVGVARRVATT